MFGRLLLLFILVPLVELFLLVEIGQRVGWWPTVALVFFTGTLGAALARSQGLRVWHQVQARTARGELPTDALLDGLMIFVAGAVLLTPGLLTDIFGFFLLLPVGRRLVRAQVRRSLKGRFQAFGKSTADGHTIYTTGRATGERSTGERSTAPRPEEQGPFGEPKRRTPQKVIVVDHRPIDTPRPELEAPDDERTEP